MRCYKAFFILFLKQSIFSFGQAPTKAPVNLSVSNNLHYGFVLPEYKFVNSFVNAPAIGTELSLNKKTTGKNVWSQIYGYPEYGISFLFSTLGNQKIFGNEWAIYPYFKNHLIRRSKFELRTVIGVGLGYATRKFDLMDNPENVAVGSHLNIHFNFKLESGFKIAKQFWLNPGLSFSHYSNANTAEPNLGHNFLTGFIGLQYNFSENIELQTRTLEPFKNKHEFALIYAAGGKHTRALQSNYYLTSSLSAEYKYHWKRKLHIGAGLDLFYDSSTKIELGATQKLEYKSQYDYRTGLHVSEEFIYDRFSFTMQQGIYLGLTDKVSKSLIYNRAILRWKFNAHILGSFSLKSHLHILEYPELGIGYYFISKKNESH